MQWLVEASRQAAVDAALAAASAPAASAVAAVADSASTVPAAAAATVASIEEATPAGPAAMLESAEELEDLVRDAVHDWLISQVPVMDACSYFGNTSNSQQHKLAF